MTPGPDVKYAEQALPPTANWFQPADVGLTVYEQGGGYGADLFALGQRLRISIRLTRDDLEVLNRQFQQEMQQVALAVAASPVAGRDELNRLVTPLAELGHSAFRRVFGADGQSVSDLLRLLGREIRGRPIYVEIPSDGLILPWELLYEASIVDGPPECGNFWGLRFVIARVLTHRRGGAFLSPRIATTSRPSLALVADRNLPGVCAKEVPLFEALHREGHITLHQLQDLSPKLRREGVLSIREFLRRPYAVLHFACHSTYSDPPELSYIVVSDSFQLHLRDFTTYDITNSHFPLVILNACQTANLNPLYTSSFVSALLEFGARGVVATECEVPDDFASLFAEELYAHLLRGLTVGESLLAIRQSFFTRSHDPTGLLYSLYGPPTLQLVRDASA